jgi:predicted RNA-binding protein with TRAM domain
MEGKYNKISVGDTLDLKIETVGKKGDGLAKIDGFVIFVPGVKEGDNVKVKVTKVLTNVGFGEVIGKADPKAIVAEKEPAEEAEEEAEEVVNDSEDFGEELDSKK